MAASLRLRGRQLDKFCRLAKLGTDDARAKFCNVSASTWHRVTKGLRGPTTTFIAGTLAAFAEYEITFEDLFEVIDDGDGDLDERRIA